MNQTNVMIHADIDPDVMMMTPPHLTSPHQTLLYPLQNS